MTAGLRLLRVTSIGLIAAVLTAIETAHLLFVAHLALPVAPISQLAAPTIQEAYIQPTRAFLLRWFASPLEQQFMLACDFDRVERSGFRDPRQLAELAREVAQLPPGDEREADQAHLAYLMGNTEAAFTYGVRGRAYRIVERSLDGFDHAGNYTRERELTLHYIAALRNTLDREALAAAWWRLGRIDNMLAERPQSTVQRREMQREAYAAFRAEIALTPLNGQALLTGAYAALALADRQAAADYFTAAIKADPASASGYVGLARVALAQGDRVGAERGYHRAAQLAPRQSDVVELGHEFHE